MSFEEKLEKLEKIAQSLKKGEVGLEESVEAFEEGIKLARGLEKELSKLERRVEILVNEPTTEGEKPILELFPELNN